MSHSGHPNLHHPKQVSGALPDKSWVRLITNLTKLYSIKVTWKGVEIWSSK